MLVAEKTHHINTYIYGQGSDYVIQILREKLPDIQVLKEDESSPDDDEYIDSRDSEIMKEIEQQITPGDVLKIRRENREWSQAELSQRSGIAVPNISLMEAGKRPVGARTAKKLALALGCDVSDFIK